jgi:hypothetical protein
LRELSLKLNAFHAKHAKGIRKVRKKTLRSLRVLLLRPLREMHLTLIQKYLFFRAFYRKATHGKKWKTLWRNTRKRTLIILLPIFREARQETIHDKQ